MFSIVFILYPILIKVQVNLIILSVVDQIKGAQRPIFELLSAILNVSRHEEMLLAEGSQTGRQQTGGATFGGPGGTQKKIYGNICAGADVPQFVDPRVRLFGVGGLPQQNRAG